MGGGECDYPGCTRVRHGKGLCATHYRQMQRRGFVSEIAVVPNPHEWLLAHVEHKGEECLAWPFFRTTNGYAGTRIGGHREMCILAHGEPPFEGAVAAHSCGKGHEGCVNPNHLSWKTPKQNSADMAVHGTLMRGETHSGAKLTAEDVMEIRQSDSSLSVLAKAYAVHKNTIAYAKRGQSWSHI